MQPSQADARNDRDLELARLSPTQRAALRHVERTVCGRQADANDRLTNILQGAGCAQALYDAAIESVRRHARVVLHFHPDRLDPKGITVAEALLHEGQYRSQFQTGLSSGSRTAFPGGERDNWERTLFGGAYHTAGATPDERPKYGALELIRHPDGPWPRFGSCYLVLRAAVSQRASFTFLGSEQALAPERMGLIDRLACVMAALLAEIVSGAGTTVPWPPFVAPTLGVKDLTVAGLIERLTHELPLPRPSSSTRPPGRVLDSGIEAQVHGPVDLQRDAESLVIDPAFRGTPTAEWLKALCRKYTIPLDWHCGFRLPARDVPADFRGPAMPQLAQRIVGDGVLDAAMIGAAEASLRSRPQDWQDWGSPEETLQQLKQLWHVLVHYGTPTQPGWSAE